MKIVKFPTYRQPAGRGKLYGRFFLSFPMSLVKSGGVWQEVITPSQDQLAVADKYYIGGYTYPLTDSEAADLGTQYWVDV